MKNHKPNPFNLSVTINGNPWSGEVAVENAAVNFSAFDCGSREPSAPASRSVRGLHGVGRQGRPVSSCNYLAFEAHGRSC
jgi:hypothetical protein